MNKGFTLLEVLLSIFLITVGMGGIFILVLQTVSFSSMSFNQFIASQLAQEGLEVVRNIRDSNWLTQRSKPEQSWKQGIVCCPASPCLCQVDYDDAALSLWTGPNLKFGQGFYNYDSGVDSKFNRKITVAEDPENPDILEILVEVVWQEAGQEHKIAAQENLYNWR